jgi:hypothetical protein
MPIIDQTKRTGRGTKESPLTQIQLKDLSDSGIGIGGNVPGKGKLLAGGFFETPTSASPSQSGITTSDNAEKRGQNANDTINNITTPSDGDDDPFSALFDRINTLQTDLKSAREKEKIAQDAFQGKDAQSKLKKIDSSEEAGFNAQADLNAGVDALTGRGDAGEIEDPVIRALTDKTSANIGIMQNQMQTLSQYRNQFNEYTQQDIDSIARTAERSIERQLAENDRTKRAMQFAGVVGGRAQFSPVVEQSIINDVIEEGLDRIEVINEKKNSAIREARKAEADFNIDVFEQQADLAKEFNNEIESTISAMNAQVRQVEKDDRERMTFRQDQEERNSLILAEELVDATPEQIMQAAAANGIDPGLLTKAINDAKFESQDRDLTLEGKRANIALANNKAARDAAGGGTEPMTVAEIKQFSERNGWVPPQGMSLSKAQAIDGGLRLLPEAARQEYSTLRVTNPEGAAQFLEETLDNVSDVSIEDKLGEDSNKGVKALYEDAATKMGIVGLWPFNDFKEVAKTDQFKEAYKTVVKEKMSSVENEEDNMFATDGEFLKKVLDKTLELNTSNNKRLEELQEAINNAPNQNRSSTPAVNF